jgi:hypothetical protein
MKLGRQPKFCATARHPPNNWLCAVPLHARAARGGPGRLAGAPQPKAVLRKRDGGNDGSALDTATEAAAPRLSYGSVTNGNWRKSIRNKSLEFTGFHYQRLKAVSAFSAEKPLTPYSASVGDRSDLWHAPLIRQPHLRVNPLWIRCPRG